MAGCQTAVSNIVMSVVVFLTLEFITPLFKYTPNAILAAIIISAVLGLIDYEAAILIWKIDKFDFVACMGAFFGVVFASVEIGLLIAVRASSNLTVYLRKIIIIQQPELIDNILSLNRSQYHLLRFSSKSQGREQLLLVGYPGQMYIETFSNTPRQQKFLVY